MASVIAEGRTARGDAAASDRTFFLAMLGAIWAIVLAGFVPDSLNHVTGTGQSYPLVVHLHVLCALAWLSLLSAQVLLVRCGRVDLHRKLGLAAAGLIPAMIVLGLSAFWTIQRIALAAGHGNPQFLIVPLANVTSFALMGTIGMALRRRSPALHKRFMLLGTILLLDAGFSRWIGEALLKLLGEGPGPFFVAFYTGNVLMIGALLGRDLVTQRRVAAPVALAGAFGLSLNALASALYFSPAWKALATRLLGF